MEVDEDLIRRLEKQADGIMAWLHENHRFDSVAQDAKHLDKGSIERVYWHYRRLKASLEKEAA